MGAGVVGTALAARLVRAGVPVTGLHGRQVELSDAARAISGVVGQHRRDPGHPLGVGRGDHLGARRAHPRGRRAAGPRGAAAARAGPAAHVGRQPGAHDPGGRACRTCARSARCTRWSRSPTRAWPSRGCDEVAFGIEGDEPARAIAKRIVRALGARAVFLDAENLALYHAGAVMASNYVVALADAAQSLLVKAGVPAEQALPVLIPLLSSVVQNLAQRRAAGRADRAGRARRRVVGRAAPARRWQARAPELLELYRLVGRDVLRLATREGAAGPGQRRAAGGAVSGAAPGGRRGANGSGQPRQPETASAALSL